MADNNNISNVPDSDNDSDTEALDLFVEPADYYPPSPTPTTATHKLIDGMSITLHLVGHNPLWGHYLWNAGRIIATYLEKDPILIQGKTVLELGAGAGLPSMICGIFRAEKVVVTDYPDPDLIQNLWLNIEACEKVRAERDEEPNPGERRVVAKGYCWGADVQPLFECLAGGKRYDHISPSSSPASEGFDVLILADLLFNHSEHGKLVSTIQKTLRKSAESKSLVFFTPYRPWLYDKDMAFFDLVKEAGFTVEKILEEKMDKVMFERDPGNEELRRTVFGYELKWAL